MHLFGDKDNFWRYLNQSLDLVEKQHKSMFGTSIYIKWNNDSIERREIQNQAQNM